MSTNNGMYSTIKLTYGHIDNNQNVLGVFLDTYQKSIKFC